MATRVGDRLGSYEIVGPLGKGGMGEVYRGRDTKLDREVAVKVLPEALAGDQERLIRFEREAKALAALNHPNIAQIYAVEGTAFIMELVPGETLGERMKRGAISVDEALNIAAQMASALDAAHEKGIIHRDFKPGNVMVTPDGVVKVLDFGLVGKAPSSNTGETRQNAEDSPTLTLAATQAGVIMGTAAYMAPEQASGKPVDKRADIWAFGVVLWEMLAGKRLFEGETISHVLAAVLTKEADFTLAPEGVRPLLASCLEKDPKKRLRDVGDAMRLVANDRAIVAQAGRDASKKAPFGWIGAATVTAALAAVSFFYLRQQPAERPLTIVTSLTMDGDAAAGPPDAFSFLPSLPALSPDGTSIVLGAKSPDGKNELWLRRLDSEAAQVLPGTNGAILPFWSPDSGWVAFEQDGKLKKINTRGGIPVVICDLNAPTFRSGSWNAQGTIIFNSTNGGYETRGIYSVSADGGVPAPVSKLGIGARSPWFLPDGRHFLYTDDDTTTYVGSLDEPKGPNKQILRPQSTVVYAQGNVLYVRDGALMAQPFDTAKLELKGRAIRVAEGVPTYSPTRVLAATVSQNGLLAYMQTARNVRSRLVWKDRQGRLLGTVGDVTDGIRSMELSPDGKRVAASIRGRDGNEDIWLYSTATGTSARFTYDPRIDSTPVWSPDGATLYYIAQRSAEGVGIYRRASNSTGGEELKVGDPVLMRLAGMGLSAISPDEKFAVYASGNPGNSLYAAPIAASGRSAPPKQRFVNTNSSVSGQFSPDGKWMVYASTGLGADFQIYVSSFPSGGGTRSISEGFGSFPRWRRDGKEIYYVGLNGQLMAADVSLGNGTLEVGKAHKLFDGIVTTRAIAYDVSADGQRLLVVDDDGSSKRPLTLVQNWTTLLKQ